MSDKLTETWPIRGPLPHIGFVYWMQDLRCIKRSNFINSKTGGQRYKWISVQYHRCLRIVNLLNLVPFIFYILTYFILEQHWSSWQHHTQLFLSVRIYRVLKTSVYWNTGSNPISPEADRTQCMPTFYRQFVICLTKSKMCSQAHMQDCLDFYS